MSDPPARHYLTPLFEPASVAIIGATGRPGSVGAVLLENMLAENRPMLGLCERLGFSIESIEEGPGVKRVVLALS